MALLATQVVGVAGTTETLVAATGGGDTFVPDPNGWLEINNASGGSITVTIAAFVNGQSVTELGDAVPSHAVVVGAGVRKKFGPTLLRNVLNPSTGLANVTYSGVTSLTVGYFRM